MATATYVAPGNHIDYTPSSAVSMGDPVVLGEMVGIAVRDIAADELGAVALEGVYDLPKTSDSTTDAIAVGTKVYWDASGEVVTATAGSNKVIGFVVAAAAEDSETVRVKLAQIA